MQTAPKWLDTTGHFSLFLKGSQYFHGRGMHFRQNVIFHKRLVKTAKTCQARSQTRSRMTRAGMPDYDRD